MYEFPTFVSMNCECPICKQRVNDNALYCSNCGYLLKSIIFPIDVDLKKYNMENDINNKNEKVDKNIKTNMIASNMIIGIKIPLKLDLEKIVDKANNVMEKVSVFLESKKIVVKKVMIKKLKN